MVAFALLMATQIAPGNLRAEDPAGVRPVAGQVRKGLGEDGYEGLLRRAKRLLGVAPVPVGAGYAGKRGSDKAFALLPEFGFCREQYPGQRYDVCCLAGLAPLI